MALTNINTADFILGDGVTQDGNVITVTSGVTGGTYATGQIFVTFLGGLELQVDWPIYYIDSVQYAAGSDTITLDTADATNDRFDAVILTATGLDKITGTPSATPEQPTIDPTSQLIVTYVLVAANQTDLTSGDIKIYDEGTETTVTSNNGTLDDQSTDISPVSDTYVLKLGSFNNTHYIDFTFGSAQSIAGVTQLSYYIWLVSQFTNQTYLKWQFFLSGSPTSNVVSVTSGTQYNFLRTTTAEWQLNIIPWGAFTFTSGTFDKIRITLNGSNSDGFYLDFINLNIGVGSSSPLQNFFKTIIVDGDPVVATQPNDTLVFTGGVSKTGDKEIDFTGGGGGGHVIVDPDDVEMDQQPKLKFERLIVTDDIPNTQTVVTRPSDIFSGLTPPSNPVEGDKWKNTETWKEYTYHDSYWVEDAGGSGGGAGLTEEQEEQLELAYLRSIYYLAFK